MGYKEVKFLTVTCNGPNCDKTITCLATPEAHKEAADKNPWMLSYRNITTFDGRQFGYCSDVCEVDSITAGNHNKLEQKKVVSVDSNAEFQMRQAAEAARRAEEATKNLKEGSPVTLHT